MLDDASAFWEQFRACRAPLVEALAARYPLVPRPYVEYFVDWLKSIEGNSRVLTYIEADFGALGRGLELIDSLVAGGVRVAGARCLDIGCSYGALLLAAKARGAGECLGLDTSEKRLVSARMVCAGSGIEFLQADAREAELGRQFDLILCIDVLEHVPGWPRLIERIAGALAPAGAAFVSLYNARHPASVLSEPHYGLPGLSLLPATEAEALWNRVGAVLDNALPYEVYEWPSYAEIATTAGALGLRSMPWISSEWMSTPFWEGHRERRDALLRDTASALGSLKLAAGDCRRLQRAVADYCDLFTRDHERFERAPEARLDFYTAYYAQPLNVLLTRA